MTDPTTVVTGGVDTHKDFHVCVALDQLGRVLGTEQFPTSLRGYKALFRWLTGFGPLGAVGVEGTGSWGGAGLSRSLSGAGVKVVEVNRPNRQARRRRGKSDPADAEAAARAVLAGEALGTPKAATGAVEAVRLLRIARRSAMKARTQAANQLHSVIDTAPEALRAKLLGLKERERVTKAAHLRPGEVSTPLGAAKFALASLARRWLALSEEIALLDAQARRAGEYDRPISGRHQRCRDRDSRDVAVRRRGQPDQVALRSFLRRLVRLITGRRFLGPSAPPPAQPRRRPPSQQRLVPDRVEPPGLGPTHQGLHEPAHL